MNTFNFKSEKQNENIEKWEHTNAIDFYSMPWFTIRFPYEIIADKKHEKLELLDWIKENIKGDYRLGLSVNSFYFQDEEDAMAFKLKF